MSVGYRNAAKVLPANVLTLLQEYVAGELLYVPATRFSRSARRKSLAHVLREQGLTMRVIAERLGVSERRVRQILAGDRRKGI